MNRQHSNAFKGAFLFLCLLLGLSVSAAGISISRLEPAFWWTGMKNPQLQIMVYGKDIAATRVQPVNYPGVSLKEVVRTDNPNYLFIYLDITPETRPGQFQLTFAQGKKKLVKDYELRPRATSIGAQGFDSSDVLYLIMPDRFSDGDTTNDNWDSVRVNRQNPFARHGGDFAGLEKHLDYIQDLGVTAVWLNPVLENKMPGGSYHGYAITDYYRVDPRFGSNADYCRFVADCHKRGLKVVMDMIYNHCGSGHWWMKDLPAKDWLNHQDHFVQTSFNTLAATDIHAPQSEKDALTKGWFSPGMPDLNQGNRLLADYLIQNSIWWIEYARIDGIRHDTHPYVDFHFLARWCKAVTDQYPHFNIVGETWYDASAPEAWWQRNSKVNPRDSYLKTAMDFRLMRAANEAFDIKNDATRYDLQKIYEVLAQDYIFANPNHLLVFLENHDTSRFMKKQETNLDRYKLALTFLLTTRGIPHLYYGSEVLLTGEKSEGDGNLRKDFPGGWPGDKADAFTAAGRTPLQNEAHDFLRKLLQWRKTSEAVRNGRLIHYAPDRNDCYVYARIKGNSRILVILNGANKAATLHPEKYAEVTGGATSGKDVITGRSVSLTQDFTVPAHGELLLEL
ncbi:MAG: glycoside hydrolase family 13 protein [Tannerella sp.]|jgi:glycosidase|nr:glycoside hydrolase family 13 protein [Tannerella sp.]